MNDDDLIQSHADLTAAFEWLCAKMGCHDEFCAYMRARNAPPQEPTPADEPGAIVEAPPEPEPELAPEPLDLSEPRTITLTRPALADEDAYEAFLLAGGHVNSMGHTLTLTSTPKPQTETEEHDFTAGKQPPAVDDDDGAEHNARRDERD